MTSVKLPSNQKDVSVLIVSFNTSPMLARCLQTVIRETRGMEAEIIVVDNCSSDDSAEIVRTGFPEVKLVVSPVNLGFAGANNLGFQHVTGRYVALLNSDAFLAPGALRRAAAHLDANPDVALGGARLTGEDGSWQPSARMFPSIVNDFLQLSGLTARYSHSRFFGRPDRTWSDPNEAADVDWVPGAFSLIRTDVIRRIGFFDESFFLYYEEVDLCRRIKHAGYRVYYWPDVGVTHLGGESSKSMRTMEISRTGSQLTLWRIRSALIYYRKHHGSLAWMAMRVEFVWHWLRAAKNAGDSKAAESRKMMQLLQQAWIETLGGRVSPARPW